MHWGPAVAHLQPVSLDLRLIPCNVFSLLLSIITLLLVSRPTLAELQPSEVAILVNKSSQISQQLARYYAKQRGIPSSQICSVAMPKSEELKRTDWNKIRPLIQRWFKQNQLDDKVRCMVTTWDVPLKIGKQLPPPSSTAKRRKLLQLERARRMERLLEFMNEFDKIAADGTGATTSESGLNESSDLKQVTEGITLRLKGAESRIQKMVEGPDKQKAVNTLTQLSIATAGLKVLTQNMQRAIESGRGNERMQQEFRFGTGRLTGLGEATNLLGGLPAGIERDTNIIVVVERAAGIVGTVSWIDTQLNELEENETYASFDSELALVLESEYALPRWVPNYLHYNYDDAPLRQVTKTLMVSRLEAPTPEATKALIDNAIAVEKTGLTGKIYLDARGAAELGKKYGPGTIEDYDSSLLRAHEMIKQHSTMEVVLNNKEQLFQQGECPDAAVYCGWVSLAQYIDAFDWKPGSIGYHIASAEAQTIRKKDSQVWCKRMLDEGVTATLGPVYEPYMLAFPKPDEFLAVLLTGRYTYAETVYRTKSTNSWTITTIGDPLYNPFKAKPALKEAPIQYRRVIGNFPDAVVRKETSSGGG